MPITLASPKKDVYLLLDMLIEIINKHARTKDYAIVKDCFKRFKKSVIIKIFVKCDVYNKIKFVDNKHRLISSQKKNCKFIVIAKLTNNYKDSKTNKEQ
jgi:hypothetical protein